jgi:hypothetical protein
MTLQVKDSSGWQEPKDIQIHADSRWWGVRGGWIKENGQWMQFWPPAAVTVRKVWLGLSEDQPVVVLEAKVDTSAMALRTNFVYRLDLRIKDQPLHTLQWRNGELGEWDKAEADGFQAIAMNSAISGGDGALPAALAAALRALPCRRQVSADELRRNHWKHWGALPFDDVPLTVCEGGTARLQVSIDNGTTWFASNWQPIDTYLNLADVAPVIARDDETTPAYVPRLRYRGTPLSYIPAEQLPHVRVGWEVWTGGDTPPAGSGRSNCLELSHPQRLPSHASSTRHGNDDERFEWGSYGRKGFVLACPPGADNRSHAVGQEWWRGYVNGSTTRVHPLNILQSQVHSGLVFDPPGTTDNSQNVEFKNAWNCRGSYWRYCVVDETPGRPVVHRFSEVLHWGLPPLSVTAPQVDLTSDYRLRVLSKDAVPAISGSNVLLPGRETPLPGYPGYWLTADAWTIYCGHYTGGSYGPLRDNEILRFGSDLLPLCYAQIAPRFPTAADQDFFDTFDPADGIGSVGGVVRLQSSWALAVPGFEISGYTGSGLDKGVYLARIPLSAWAEIGASSGTPPALTITQHPRIVHVGETIDHAPDSEARATGGVPPLTWGEWYWEASTDDQASWHLLAGTEVKGGTWVRVCCDVTDSAGSTAKAQSNSLMMKYNALFWGELPTIEITTLSTGAVNLRITQYSYGGGKAPYNDSRYFEERQNGGWGRLQSSATYTGRWQFRAVIDVSSADGQSLHYETPAKEWDFGGGSQGPIGSYPTVHTYPVIRVERDGPNVGDMVWARCVQPAAVSVPPDASFWYTAEYRLSNGGVMTHYDSRTDQQSPGDTKGFTHGTVQLVYSYTITSSSYGTVHLDAGSNTVDYDLRVFIDAAVDSGGRKDLKCHLVDNPNSRAVCEAMQKYYNSL